MIGQLNTGFRGTIDDCINAVLKGGCRLLLIDEYDAKKGDGEETPMHGLPALMLIIARKNVEQRTECDA